MAWSMAAEDDFDGVQYDTEHAPSVAHLEAAQIRRECSAWRGTCPRCAKPNATAEHVSWCNWQPY